MNQSTRSATCEARIDGALDRRLDDLRCLWTAYCEGAEDPDGCGTLAEYGLCFDYVPPRTFPGQKEAYFRYQLSWDGPSDEFRFFVNPNLSCHRIEYWFLDWFDGAHRVVSGEVESLLSELWLWFGDCGAVRVIPATAEGDAP